MKATDAYRKINNSPIKGIVLYYTEQILTNSKVELNSVIKQIQTGKTPPKANPKYYETQDVNWFKPSDIGYGKFLTDAKEKFSNIAVTAKKGTIYPENTLLMIGIGGGVGRVSILKDKGSSNQQISGISFNSEVSAEYAYYYYLVREGYIKSQAKSMSFPILNQAKIKSLEFKYPTIDEQKEFVQFIDECWESFLKNEIPNISKFNLSNELKKYTLKQFKAIELDDKIQNNISKEKHLLTQLKQSILQDAIQGKLTADWRSTKQLLSFEGEVPQAERFKITPQAQQSERFKTTPQVSTAEQSKNTTTTSEDASQHFSRQRGHINNLPHLKTFRKTLRKNLTPAEATLWKALKGKQLQGRKFRRQFSVANYILDFYCPAEKLAIELDGQGHFEATQATYDQERDLFLNHCGINVLRFENKWVWKNMEAVLQEIQTNFDWENNPSVLRTAPLKEEQYIEPASELLKRIKAEKAQLIKDKKIKKEKPLPPITKEEIPFELPERWVWCRLGEINNIFLGGAAFSSSRFLKESNIQVIRISNVKNNQLNIGKNPVFIDDINANENLRNELFPRDILITMTGTREKRDYCFTVELTKRDFDNKRLFLNQRVGCFRLNKNINSTYTTLALKSKSLLEPVFETSTGSANQANISKTALLDILFPLPPLSEQKEIVKKVDALMQHCQALEQEIHSSEANAQMLMQAVLKEAFEGQTAHTKA